MKLSIVYIEQQLNFSKKIENQNPNADKIVLIIDSARYYYNSEVVGYAAKSKQLQLVYLPPYAQKLNLIERLWKFMKRKTLYNKYYPTFKEFKSALGNFFIMLPDYYRRLSNYRRVSRKSDSIHYTLISEKISPRN